MSKSLLSSAAAKLFAVATFSVLFTTGASAQYGVGNGGNGYVGGYGAYGSDQWWITPADPNVHRGNVSLAVHNERANYTGLTLTAGTTYTFSYWVKTDASTGVGVVPGTTVPGSGAWNDSNSIVTAGGYLASTSADTNWHQYFATITPTGTDTNYEIGIDCRPASKMWWIDDVKLVEANSAAPIVNLIQDGGFEAAYPTNLDNNDTGWPTEGWVSGHWASEYDWDYFPGQGSALAIEGTPGIAHTGYASLLMNNERANYTMLYLTAGTTYNLSYWASGYGGEQIGIGDFGTNVDGVYPAEVQVPPYYAGILSGGYQAYTMTNGDWNQYFATLQPNITSPYWEFGIDSRPGPTYIDDVVLVAAGTTNNLVQDWSFETASQNTWNGASATNGSLGFAPQDGWPTAGWIDERWYSEYNWDIFQYGDATGPEGLGISGTPAVVHTGNAALEVNYKTARANYTGLSMTEGTTYTLTYWLLSTETNAPVGVTFGTTVPGSGTFNDESSCVTAGGYAAYLTPPNPTTSGWAASDWPTWFQYSATITPTNTSADFEFGIDCRPAASDWYIDDVVLVAQGSTVNLVQDPGFENAYQSNLGGDGNDWPTANWVDQHWTSEYAWGVHEYGNPAGPQALYIQGTPGLTISVAAPMIVSATRELTMLNEVEVVYNEAVQASSATNVANYALNNGNSVTSATINSTLGTVTLILANALANGTTNILTVNGVKDSTGVATIAANTEITIALPLPPLTIISAVRNNMNLEEVVVVFSAPVLASTATNPANYTVNNGNSVVSATIDATLTNVTLILSEGIGDNVAFVLTVNGVTDSAGTVIASNYKITISVPGFTQSGQTGYGGYGYVGGYGAYGSDQWWITPSDPNVYRGKASLYVHNERANYTGLSVTSGTTYTFSYWVKTDAGTAVGVVPGVTVPGSGTWTDNNSDVTAGGYQASTATDANWHQYFATIVPANTYSGTYEIGIDCRPASKSWWIDQVRLVQAGTAAPIVNLVQDGGFEAAYTTNLSGGTGWPQAGWVDGNWASEYNWDIYNASNPTGPTALTVEGAPGIARTGYACLLLNNERANYTQLTLSNGVTYNLSYWALGFPGDKIGVGGFGTILPGAYDSATGGLYETNESASITSGGYQAYEMTNENWNQYFATIVATNTSSLFEFGIDSRPGPTYIDDVVLVAQGTTINLVQDVSFEHAYQNTFVGPFVEANPEAGWPSAGWIDNLWFSEYNYDTFKYGDVMGPEALGISGTPAVVHAGNAALEVNYKTSRANYTGLSMTEGTTYTLTYWLLSTETNAPVGVTFGTTVPGSGTFADESSCVTAGGYASFLTPPDFTTPGWPPPTWPTWWQYSATITPTNTSSNFEFGIDCRPAASDWYLDDIVLVAQGSTVNLVQDPGFETAYQSNLGGDGNDWPTANWVDQHWTSEYAWAVHQYGNPAGPQALYIQGTPSVASVVGPTIGIALSSGQIVLTYAGGTLESSASVNGPWAPVAGASSPYSVAPTGSQQFYVVKQ